MPFCVKAVLLFHFLKNQGIPIAGFLDNNKSIVGMEYCGSLIFTPDAICSAWPAAKPGAAFPMAASVAHAAVRAVMCESRYYDAHRIQLSESGVSDAFKAEDAMDLAEARAVLDTQGRKSCGLIFLLLPLPLFLQTILTK